MIAVPSSCYLSFRGLLLLSWFLVLLVLFLVFLCGRGDRCCLSEPLSCTSHKFITTVRLLNSIAIKIKKLKKGLRTYVVIFYLFNSFNAFVLYPAVVGVVYYVWIWLPFNISSSDLEISIKSTLTIMLMCRFLLTTCILIHSCLNASSLRTPVLLIIDLYQLIRPHVIDVFHAYRSWSLLIFIIFKRSLSTIYLRISVLFVMIIHVLIWRNSVLINRRKLRLAVIVNLRMSHLSVLKTWKVLWIPYIKNFVIITHLVLSLLVSKTSII